MKKLSKYNKAMILVASALGLVAADSLGIDASAVTDLSDQMKAVIAAVAVWAVPNAD